MTEAQKRASAKYDKSNVVHISLKLNKKTDADIIAWLSSSKNKQGAIKRVLKSYVKR